MYNRTIKKHIQEKLFKGEIIIIYGARQTGKTTLVKEILLEYKDKGKYIDCDLIANRQALKVQDLKLLKDFIGNNELIVIDEAQRVENIGLNLKIIHDNLPNIQIIATGSSSFDLANKINEPLTGRTVEFMMYPLSLQEIKHKNENMLTQGEIESILRFGLYPGIYGKDNEITMEKLNNIASNYLYKDLLERENIKKSDHIIDLLQLLALQVGHEVSYHELGQRLGLNTLTVQKYIQLLEKSFVIFRLKSFSRNIRNEIGKSVKIYFYDIGVLNAIISNFNKIKLRNDIGGLWENFCILERLKFNKNNKKIVKSYFWRTYNQQEIDYLEEFGGKINAFEFKYNENKKAKLPKAFSESYPNTKFDVINKQNYYEFLI